MVNEELTLFYDMLNESHDMIFIIRIDNGVIRYVNKKVFEVLGYTLEELHEIGVSGFRRPLNSDEPFYRHLQELKQMGQLTDYAMLIKKDGTEIPIEANVKYSKYQGVEYNIAIVRDISERLESQKRLKELNEQLKLAVSVKTVALQQNVAFLEAYKLSLDAGNIVSKSDLSGYITYVNENFCTVSGYTREEVLGKPHSIIRHPDTPKKLFSELWETISSKRVWKGLIKNKKKDGQSYWVDINIVPILDENQNIVEYIAVRHEVTELIEQREMLEKVLTTDKLTQFGNRHKLLCDIDREEQTVLALFNIDNFREINDFYGHDFGDILIDKIANLINGIVRDRTKKSFYRLDGDEFALLGKIILRDVFIAKVQEVIQTVSETVFVIQEEEITVQVTASISFENEKSNLFRSADMAMKYAKKSNQRVMIYDESLLLDAEYEQNIKWTKKLQNAIRHDRIEVYFQPIVHNESGEFQKYESLIRLIDDAGNVVTPFFFLEIAKRTKYYETLTKVVIKKSFEQFKELTAEFSVNLTIHDIMDEETQRYIFEMLDKYRIGKRVVFEIVESEGIDNYEKVMEFITNVKRYGCKIAIDDFGTGYSNFDYLLKLKADYIKIDGSLIKSLSHNLNSRILVSTIVSFAKQIGMLTIAEFVENEESFHHVKAIGIDFSQGYYFGKPESSPQSKV